jgi:hypothetical protein
MSYSAEAKQAVSWDSLSLAVITFLSAVPYLPRLGFYSDDFEIIRELQRAHVRGRWPIAEILQISPARPLHGLYATLLFEVFGRNPLGYHIVNTAVLAASVVLFYLLLARLRVGRGESLATALVFVVLPQLSTIRVWFAAFQVTLSLALMLASLHCQLSFARSGKPAWGALAFVAALLSLAAYEIFTPLLASFAIGLAVAAMHKRRVRGWRSMIAPTVVAMLLAAALLFKITATSRAGSLRQWDRYVRGAWQLVRPDYDWRVDSGLNIFAALDTHFWRVVGEWASAAVDLVAGRLGLLTIGASAAATVLALWRLRAAPPIEPRSVRLLLLLGAASFVLGHALFVVVPAIAFTPTGIDNRVLVGAALGVAMILAGAIAIAARAIFRHGYDLVFPLLVSAALFLGMLRLNAIELYWAETPALQRSVLESARRDLASVPAGSTIILDGVCPYHGPAIVFETWWDTGPALSFALHRSLIADVVSPRTLVAAGGIQTAIYRQPSFYPYGPHLYAYDVRRHATAALPNEGAAHNYFARRPALRCPTGYVARGVPV